MIRPDGATSTVVRCAVDLVRLGDVAGAIRDFGDRYLNRLFTPHELDACRFDGSVRTSGLAARFAAKEAAIKLLRQPDLPAPWHDVEVVTDREGWPSLRLYGQVRELVARRGLHDLDLSMSHDGGYAVAVVTAQETTKKFRSDPTRWSHDQHDDT